MQMKLEEEWGSNSEPRKNATNGSYFLPAPLGITFFCLPPMLFTERNRSSPSFIGTAPRLRSCLRQTWHRAEHQRAAHSLFPWQRQPAQKAAWTVWCPLKLVYSEKHDMCTRHTCLLLQNLNNLLVLITTVTSLKGTYILILSNQDIFLCNQHFSIQTNSSKILLMFRSTEL